MNSLKLPTPGIDNLTTAEMKEIDGGVLYPPIGLGIIVATVNYIDGIREGYNDATND